MDNKYYYGLSQADWDNLIIQAEDLLRDNELGTHLVGIYPTGERIFGVKSSPPKITCLYVDSVETLLDPLAKDKDKFVHTNKDKSEIHLIDLFEWVKRIDFPDWWDHVVPMNGDIAYQEDSIEAIIYCAQEVLEYNWLEAIENLIGADKIEETFIHRAAIILQETGQWLPCIEKEWANRISDDLLSMLIPREYCEIIRILDNYFTDGIPYVFLNNFNASCRDKLLKNNNLSKVPQQRIDRLRKAVIDFYRFQL